MSELRVNFCQKVIISGGILLAGLFLLASFPGPGFPGDIAPVRLKTEVEIATAPLFFSDVVAGELPAELEDFYLGELPAAGRSRFINRADIVVKARENEKPVPNFTGRTLRTHVRRPSRLVEGEVLEERAYEVLREQFARGGELELNIEHPPQDVQILPGEFELKLDSRNPYHRLRGADWYPFKIVQEGKTTAKFRVRASLRQFSLVPVALNSLRRGEQLEEEDIVWEERDISSISSRVARDTSSIVGLETGRSFRAGEIIDPRGLERPLKVQRREKVTILYDAGNIRVSVPGYSEDDGAVGDEVIVKNNSSGEKVYAEVIGERKVKAK